MRFRERARAQPILGSIGAASDLAVHIHKRVFRTVCALRATHAHWCGPLEWQWTYRLGWLPGKNVLMEIDEGFERSMCGSERL